MRPAKTFLILLVLTVLGALPVKTIAVSDPCFDPELILLEGGLNPNNTVGFTRPYSAGTRVEVTAILMSATVATFSSGRSIFPFPDDPSATVPGMIIHDFYAAGNYTVNVHNSSTSNGSIRATIKCKPIPGFVYGVSKSSESTGPVIPANLLDGRINKDINYDVAAPIAVYKPLDIYAIQPETSSGQFALRLTEEEITATGIPQDENVLLAEGTNPFTGQPIVVHRLTTGEIQITTAYSDGKPYIIVWLPEKPDNLYHLNVQ